MPSSWISQNIPPFSGLTWPHFYQTRSAWSVDQGSNKNHSPAYNFAPTVTKFCVMWEGLSLPHDTKFGNCRCKIVDSRSFPSWSLIHGLRWSGLIKVGPGEDTIASSVMPYKKGKLKDKKHHQVDLTWELLSARNTFGFIWISIHSLPARWI